VQPVHLEFATKIRGSAETIFDCIADMPNYGHWLPGSNAFGGTTDVAPYPVTLGTTYLDAGPAGERPGRVTGFEPPAFIEFHQTMLVKQWPLRANLDILKWYRLKPGDSGTEVQCVLDMTVKVAPAALSSIGQALIVAAFKKENERVLAVLKRHVETGG
jgi:hypothetical protein